MEEFIALVRDRIETDETLTQTSVAMAAGISRPYLCRILAGDQTPSMSIAERIAGAVGLEIGIYEAEK